MLPDEPDIEWARDARAELDALRRGARHVTAEAALRAGDPRTARRIADVAVEADRFDETAHRLLMAAHQAAGDPNRALAVFRAIAAEALDRRAGESIRIRRLGGCMRLVLAELVAFTDATWWAGRAARRGVAPGCPEVRELIGRGRRAG